eukprot:SAG11_NODE_4255_length_1984_cov_5.040849_1_plen_86_part_10
MASNAANNANAADQFLEKNLLAHPALPESGVLTETRIQTAKNVWQLEFAAGSSHAEVIARKSQGEMHQHSPRNHTYYIHLLYIYSW